MRTRLDPPSSALHSCSQVRAAAWAIAASKALGEGERGAAAGLALGAMSSAALLPLYALANRKLAASPRRQLPLR